ncbi:hypothetical protein Adt_14974 [Abeliophyllum distichum]|uniref:Uncharacterized protein n=1 Tax=Abeliophyllum distichum TaxID=126358 RepID=A0ABD1U156_9LAMI
MPSLPAAVFSAHPKIRAALCLIKPRHVKATINACTYAPTGTWQEASGPHFFYNASPNGTPQPAALQPPSWSIASAISPLPLRVGKMHQGLTSSITPLPLGPRNQ